MLNLFKNNRNIKAIYIVTITISVIAFLKFNNGINVDGVRYLTVIDGNGIKLNNIIVVPLYSKSFVIGIGPDGKGFHSKQKLIVSKPFKFNSGDDLMANNIKTKGIYLPPLIFIGNSNYVDNWLFVKKGYYPKLARSSDIYSETPIIMIRTITNDNDKLFDMLLESKYDQNVLKKQFGIEKGNYDIVVVLDEKDIALLKSNR